MYLRRLPKFEYLAPKSIAEACALLARHKGSARVMAGGTDLLVQMKGREVMPKYLVGLKNIAGMDKIEYDKAEGLKIGSLATHASIASSPIIKEKFGCLADAVSQIGFPQTRNVGTIGGNLCNAAPSADSAPILIALGAKVKMTSVDGERTVLLEKFFTGPGQTVLGEDAILTEIQVPNQPPDSGGAYVKLSLRSAVAAVGVAAQVVLDSSHRVCTDARIVLGAVAPTPIRAGKAEEAVKGKKLDESLIEQAGQIASGEASPISDVRTSMDYRRKMVKILTIKALSQALSRRVG